MKACDYYSLRVEWEHVRDSLYVSVSHIKSALIGMQLKSVISKETFYGHSQYICLTIIKGYINYCMQHKFGHNFQSATLKYYVIQEVHFHMSLQKKKQ